MCDYKLSSNDFTLSVLWSSSVYSNVTSAISPSSLSDMNISTGSHFNMVTTVASSSPSVQEALESLPDYKATLAVWRYCPPFILVLGTAGNVMTLWVLSVSPGSSSSMPIYFRALAVSDLTLLFTGLLRHWVRYTFHFDIRDTHSAVCKIHIFLVYVTGVTSAWFLVMMTVARALSVVWPHKMGQFNRSRIAFITVAVIIISSCALNANILYGYEVRYYPDDGKYYCNYLNPEYERFERVFWPWVDLCSSSLLPFCFLLVSNSLLMWKVTSSIRDVKKLTSTGQRSQEVVSQRQKMSTSLNVTLISLSVTFVLLTSPVCAHLILQQYLNFFLMGPENTEHNAALNLAWAVTSLLWYLNSAINFYLYCLTGSRFRAQVWQCLCCVVTSKGKSVS